MTALCQSALLTAFGVLAIQLRRAALLGGAEYALQKRPAAAVCWGMVGLIALARFAPLSVNLGVVCATAVLCCLTYTVAAQTALVAALGAAIALCLANVTLAGAALGISAGALAAGAVRGRSRSTIAAAFLAAFCSGFWFASSVRSALVLLAAAILGAVVFLVLPTAALHRLAPALEEKDPTARCAAKLNELARALGQISDTVLEVCCALPDPRTALALPDALCAGICKNCKHNCTCWVEGANAMADGMLSLQNEYPAAGCVTPQALPRSIQERCCRPAELCRAINGYFAQRLAMRCAAAKTDALRAAVTEQLAALSQTLGNTATELTAPPPLLRYRAEVATAGDAANGVSADVQRNFCDLRGRMHLVLSDGTGTGSAAAVDGTMAVSLTRNLLSAGFGSDAAAKLVNIALSLTGAEGSATLDVVTLDLTDGGCRVYKAGGAPTYFVRGGHVGALEAQSLPVGMLDGVHGSTTDLSLGENDLIVMVSDGMLAAGDEWLQRELLRLQNAPPQTVANLLLEGARKRRTGRADDMTVTVARMVPVTEHAE